MTLIVADNQDITRIGLMHLAASLPIYSELKEVRSREELLEQLEKHPDAVVILDYTLFNISLENLLILQERFEQVQWIIFSESLSESFIRRIIFSSNSFSIVLKEVSLTEIHQSLKEGYKKRQYICSQVTQFLSQKEPELKKEISPLTNTEKEILKLIALGKTTKEIAAQRFSSIHTVMTHRKNIFRKLEINNIHEATKYALRAGILDVGEYAI